MQESQKGYLLWLFRFCKRNKCRSSQKKIQLFSIESTNIECSPKKHGLDIRLPGTIHSRQKTVSRAPRGWKFVGNIALDPRLEYKNGSV